MRYLTIFLFCAMLLFIMAGCGTKEETSGSGESGNKPFFQITFTPTLDVNNVNTNTQTSNPSLTNTSTATSNPTLTNTANSSASSTPTLTNTATNTNTITVPK